MKKIFLFLPLIFLSGLAAANMPGKAAPVEISAAKSLEWSRKDKTYTAREKVIVTQGSSRIQSDILVARYTDDNGATGFSTLEANGRVTIQSPPYAAYGDHAVYDVKTGNALLTGKELKLTTAADLMTAQDKIEFFSAEQRLTATGKATATHGSYTVTADILGAYFDKDASGKMALKKITAHGHVFIKTDRETVTGDEGVYDVVTQKAVLTGKVLIRQEQNWLEGTSANIDMTTGISQLLGSGNPETEGRVKGVFYPSAGRQKTEGP
jgi:lipopolysaccharide export system protein LptA